jgi:RimJ/RimL family protein N-acetyltransferase
MSVQGREAEDDRAERPEAPWAQVVLETPRLIMRPLTRAYLADLVDMYEDPEVTRFLKSLDEAGHLQRLRESEEMWATRGYGRAAIHDRATGRFVGRGGLQYWAHFDEVEVTWALRREAWGQGLATEAGGAWLDWGLEHLDVSYVTAYVDPENAASRSVAERMGMAVLRTDVQHDRRVLVYARARGDRWDAAGPGLTT